METAKKIKTPAEKEKRQEFIEYIEQREKEIEKHPDQWLSLEEFKKELAEV